MYRYNPEQDKFPYMKKYKINKPASDIMILDLLHLLKEEDETISYRHLLRTEYGDPALTNPSPEVTVVYTDEAFYEEYEVYPLRRVDLATIVTRLSAMGASVIGVDM